MGSALSKTPDSCLAPSITSPCEDTREVCDPEEWFSPYLTMLAARSQTSSVQNCEKLISAIYKPPNYGILLDMTKTLTYKHSIHACTLTHVLISTHPHNQVPPTNTKFTCIHTHVHSYTHNTHAYTPLQTLTHPHHGPISPPFGHRPPPPASAYTWAVPIQHQVVLL